MPFYLRKHFNAGPIRLNLSKGGLGVSAGVTGARVGVNRRGAYVHGGRHGLYYRKHLNQGSRKGAGRAAEAHDGSGSGPVYIFVDTGLTYETSFAAEKRPKVVAPELPSAWNRLAAGLGISVFLVAFAASARSDVVLAASLVLPFLAVGYGIVLHRRNQQAEKLREESMAALVDENNPGPALAAIENDELGGSQKAWLHYQLYDLLVMACCLDGAAVTGEDLCRIDARTAVPEKDRLAIKAGAFAHITDTLLADHRLSEDEETALRELARRLDLPENTIEAELTSIAFMARMREAREGPLEPVDCDIRLRRGETCYFMGEGRLLQERVQRRYQRDNVQYRELGYAADMEGTIYLTDRRILIVHKGTRSYRLNRILDEELCLEGNTVRLTLDGRKNPVILTVPDAMVFAARLECALEE